MLIDFQTQSPTERYKLMASSIIPRPIAWVVTEGEVVNIAPFSYFTPLSSEPATLLISIGHRADGTPKDTLRNLRQTQKCVICMVGEEHFDSMHLSSKPLQPNESEVEIFNIETQKLLEGFPPVPTNIQVALFCEYLQEVDLKGSQTIPTIVEIKQLYINNEIISNQEPLFFELNPIARVARSYVKLGEELTPPSF